MFSRLALNFAKNANITKVCPALVGSVRMSGSNIPPEKIFVQDEKSPYQNYAPPGTRYPWEGPERDVQNFPRPIQSLNPGKVRFLFIPEEWFDFFYKKTGVTGPYVLFFGTYVFLHSKEWWIIEHEYGYVYSMYLLIWGAYMKFGDKVSAYAEKSVVEHEEELKQLRVDEIQEFKDEIEEEKDLQFKAEAQKLIYEAKRENVDLQVEAAYRERAFQVYNEVKKRLEFHSQKELMERRVSQKHMVNWISDQVVKSITPQQEKDTLKKCLVDLQSLAART